MKQLICIVLQSMLVFLEGKSLNDEDSQLECHLPGKTVLYNILREQNRPVYRHKFKTIEDLTGDSLSANCLTLFLNRFQPAMDRDSKKLVGSEDEFDCSNFLSKSRKCQPSYWLNKGRESVKRDNSEMTNRQEKLKQVCTKLPGKVICKFGRFTYVINTKGREMSNEELEKVVDIMQQRISEGDKTFDICVMGPANSMSSIGSRVLMAKGLTSEDSAQDCSPVMVECSPVERSVQNKSPLPEGVKEKIFSCKWHPLKLKRATKGKPKNTSEVEVVTKHEDKPVLYFTAVAKTCSTQVFIRKFSDVCTTTASWCPETTMLPCSSTFLPHCIPWCNPFLKQPSDRLNQPQRKPA